MTKRKDANDLVREGKALDPSHRQTLTLEVDSNKRCMGLDLERSENGRVRSTQSNAITLLRDHPRWRGVLGLDLRTETSCFVRRPPAYCSEADTFPRPITDADQTAAIEWMSHQTEADFPEHKVHRAIEFVARMHGFDPVAQYLQALQWDGHSRLDDWLTTYLGAPDCDYTKLVGAKFLISGVARALRPGCQVDHVLVLEGAQGIGKTSALRVLAGQYHRADPPPLGTRDAKEALRGCWIVEIGELDSMNKSELSAVKNFLSQTEDHFRVPYGRRSETRLRRVIFAATTNETEYLRDHTGNRRFWPVECRRANLQRLAADRDQLWAEAVVRFRRGEPWHLTTAADQQLASLEQARRVELDPWHDRVADYAASHPDFTASEVLQASRRLRGPSDPARNESRRSYSPLAGVS